MGEPVKLKPLNAEDFDYDQLLDWWLKLSALSFGMDVNPEYYARYISKPSVLANGEPVYGTSPMEAVVNAHNVLKAME